MITQHLVGTLVLVPCRVHTTWNLDRFTGLATGITPRSTMR